MIVVRLDNSFSRSKKEKANLYLPVKSINKLMIEYKEFCKNQKHLIGDVHYNRLVYQLRIC